MVNLGVIDTDYIYDPMEDQIIRLALCVTRSEAAWEVPGPFQFRANYAGEVQNVINRLPNSETRFLSKSSPPDEVVMVNMLLSVLVRPAW